MEDNAHHFSISLPNGQFTLRGGDFRTSSSLVERAAFGGLAWESQWTSRWLGGHNVRWGGAAFSFYESTINPVYSMSDYKEDLARVTAHLSYGATTTWGPYRFLNRPLYFCLGRYLDLKSYYVFPLLSVGPSLGVYYEPTRDETFYWGVTPMFQGAMNVEVAPGKDGIFNLSVPAYGTLFRTAFTTKRWDRHRVDQLECSSTLGWFETSLLTKLNVSVKSTPIHGGMRLFIESGYLEERSTLPRKWFVDREFLLQAGVNMDKAGRLKNLFLGPYFKVERYQYGNPELLNQTIGLKIQFQWGGSRSKIETETDQTASCREKIILDENHLKILQTHTLLTDFAHQLNQIAVRLRKEIDYLNAHKTLNPDFMKLLEKTGSQVEQLQSLVDLSRHFAIPVDVHSLFQRFSAKLTDLESDLSQALAGNLSAIESLLDRQAELGEILLALDQQMLPGITIRNFLESPEQSLLQLLTIQLNTALRRKNFKWLIGDVVEIKPADIAANWIAVENLKIKRMPPVTQTDALNWFYYLLKDEKDHLKNRMLELLGGKTSLTEADVEELMTRIPAFVNKNDREVIQNLLRKMALRENVATIDAKLEQLIHQFLTTDVAHQAARLIENQFNRLVLSLRYDGRHLTKLFALPSHSDAFGVRLPGEEALRRDQQAMSASLSRGW